MQFIFFIVVACDISGKPCQEYTVPFTELSELTCMMVAPQLVAEWQQAHPHKFAKKWRCASELEKKA